MVGFAFAGGSASAADNPVGPDRNVTTCAQVGFAGSTQYNGSTKTGVDVTSLFTATVTSDQFVTISAVAPGVTFQAVVIKGGDGYNTYSQPTADMQSPLNGGNNVPALSHWFACYTYVPPTPEVPMPEVPMPEVPMPEVPMPEVPTPEVPMPEVPTPEAPVAEAPVAEAPTPVKPDVASAGPTTTARGALPITGNGQASGQLLLVGFLLMGFGSVVLMVSRRPAGS